MKSRVEVLETIESNYFDACVIGGGATGAGCALDAQLRGLNTVLVDAADFASGASSSSTKMVHGGVRYLEQAVRRLDIREYDVVKRALRERIRMLRNAPFLTRTREFITPCYSWHDVAYYEIGLKLYDWIAGGAGLAPSRFVSREEALRRIPALNPDGLLGAVAYTDGQFDDARYNVALVETFTEAGGEALNHARVVAFSKDAARKIASAEIKDSASGLCFTIRARVFVNATGAFADSLRQMAAPGASPRMRPSRGVHIVLPLAALAAGSALAAPEAHSARSATQHPSEAALLIPKTDDGRVLFAIPWLGRLLVGTTDEAVEKPEAEPVSRSEIEYLLRHFNRYLAQPVTPAQIVSAFAGIRPLISSDKSRRSATKELARDHVVEVDRSTGLVSILGGKWTTYRAMAEDAIDAVERQLNRPHVPCRTADYPLAGSDGFAPDSWHAVASDSGISEASAQHLTEKFGSRAAEVLALARQNPTLTEPLIAVGLPNIPGPVCHSEPRIGSEVSLRQAGISRPEGRALAAIKAEVVFCVRYEMAVSIEDVLARRLGVESYGWREALAAAPAVADLLAAELGWPEEQKRRALDDYTSLIRRLMRRASAPAQMMSELKAPPR
jgi:glycerol-3-phosphate dehydrogenase